MPIPMTSRLPNNDTMWPARILTAIILLSSAVAGQGLFRITGIVTDTEGGRAWKETVRSTH
jgi:hypothetical protein